MTISQGGTIQAVDYNTLRTQVSNILGSGSGDYGYGQTVSADTPVVADTDIVTAATTTVKQWVALYNDMLKIANHQGGTSTTAMTILTEAYTNNIQSGKVIQYSDINLISTTLTTLANNRLNIVSTQYSTEALVQSTRTTQWGSPSKTTVQHSFNVSFDSSDAARYFFNAGGQILFTASRTGGTSTAQNTDWGTLLSSMGTIVFNQSAVTSSSGTNGYGFKDITTGSLVYSKGGYLATGGAVYSANDYNITATRNGGVLIFNITFNDDAKNKTDQGYGLYDYVDGTLTSTIQIRRPTGVNVSLPSPTASNTTLLSDGVMISYSVTPTLTSINEGSTVTFNVTATNYGTGTLYWSNNGTTNASDFSDSANSGSISITSDYGSFTRTLTNDVTTEGSETIVIQLRTGSTSGTVVANSVPVNVSDTSAPPTYSISPSSTSVNEGSTVTYTVVTTGVGNATLYWTHNGSSNGYDFPDGQTSGSVAISNNTGSFTRTLVNDNTTEGTESFLIELRTGSTNGPIVATANRVYIQDTSTLVASFTLTPTSSSVNEGSSLTFTVTGNNIPDNLYYWTTSYGTASDTDFSGTYGPVGVSNNTGTFTVTPTADNLTEGAETFTVYLRTISRTGQIVAQSSLVIINDTSLSITYALAPLVGSTFNEGDMVYFSATGTNVTNGTYYWTINYVSNLDSSDFLDVSGRFKYLDNSGLFTVIIVPDRITEGSGIFTVSIRSVSIYGTVLATSSQFTVNDTGTSSSPLMTVTANYTELNESNTLNFVNLFLNGANVATQTIYYELFNYNQPSVGEASEFDFTSPTFGTLNWTSGMTNVPLQFIITADNITEGPEKFRIIIHTGSYSGPVIGYSPIFTINDTSLSP